MNALGAAVLEALGTAQTETGCDREQLFGERVLEPEQMSASAAHAVGIIEGAAIALGLTALELLDEVDGG